MHRRRGTWLLACALIAAACARPAGQQAASRPPGAIVSELDGVVLIMDVKPNPVAPGQHPSFVAVLSNERGERVDINPGGCGFANLRVTIPVPWEPTGRTWTGREGWFKAQMLSHASSGSGAAAFAPIDASLQSTPCVEDASNVLEVGETRTADFTLAIDDFLQTYTHPASVQFAIDLELDLQNSPPPVEPGYTGIPPRFFPEYRHLTASGELEIAGRPATVLTAGQAIDALLDDDRWTTWLARQDLPTCQTANLFLDSDTDQPAENVAVWYIQLYCETEEERHIGAARVDAATGEVRRLDVCDEGCE